MSGAGPDAWGRVLISAAKVASHTDPVTLATTVTLELDFQGDEIAERTVRIRRKVWADDPNDIGSAMHYEVEQLDDIAAQDVDLAGLSPSARRVQVILDESGDWLTLQLIGDALATDSSGGPPLKRPTIQTALAALVSAEMAESAGILGTTGGKWRSSHAHSDEIGTENGF